MFSTPEEDEMGSPQPSAGALAQVEKWWQMHMRPGAGWPAATYRVHMAYDLDAYAAAALTDEQRDVWRSTKDEQPPEGEWVFWWMPISEEVLHGVRTGGWVHGDGWDYALEDLSHWRRIAPPNLS